MKITNIYLWKYLLKHHLTIQVDEVIHVEVKNKKLSNVRTCINVLFFLSVDDAS